MEKGPRWRSPQQIEASWQSRADMLLRPLLPKPVKHTRLRRVVATIAASPLGKAQQKMSTWPGRGAAWLIEKVNGPLEKRLDTMEKHPEALEKRIEHTVYKELRQTAQRIEDRLPTKIVDALPWVVAGAGFFPVVGTFVTMAVNAANSAKAAFVERNPRKAGLYLLFVPLNPALGLLSVVPFIGWIFFPPAILSNSIFLEEMSKKYKIALSEGELQLALENTQSSQMEKSIAKATRRFETLQERKNKRRKNGVLAITAQDVLTLQLQKKEQAEKEATAQLATKRNRKQLIKTLRQSENTELLRRLLSLT